ncbi:hypothetical protein BA895_05350 [Humibacillus sp. DSM 29435]|uniref:LuxR C-terminal-related transcriptional regulator n=1 Tax=Humibacillus sp. DSM 29435 TaxID=1869167 RepID=UPI000871F441|nr:LuxR C-terminal-related transcriptional regulator [Humibacillus sp. DSM 29435]OFE15924.1 hypothetical protein BA895_05350 [Humibacillus sp. DSM 29435]
MARPVIATKLYVPRPRPGLVPRPRLLERLRRGAEARLTLVSAPAGFGKSTLLAAWLGGRAVERSAATPAAALVETPSVAWVSLDRGDIDPASFWTYVLTAIRNAAPEAGAKALAQLEQDAAATEPALTTLVNELARAERAMTIVLDDYHLAESREVGEGLAFLLEHLPPQVHVVVSTRADPGLPLSRMRVRRELVEIRAADLRFTADEAAAYLQSVAGLHLARADVAVLEERTEGWIAALQLVALSLQGRDDVGGFIAGFAGDDRYVVDYLVEEVLAHQPGPVRDFLLRSAVLDRFTGPLCDAVTGNTVTGSDGGSHLLVTLERANLFIVPLDDRREWFRFHHLFADVLRARLAAEQPELVPRLHQRASRWFEQHDLPDEAITHALAARDLDRATYLIELAVPAIRRHRQESVLIGWLRALPEDAVRRSPVLSVYYAFMLMATGDVEGIEPWLDAAELALAEPPGSSPPRADTDDLRTLPATIAVHRASLAQARGDVAGTTAHARRALELAGPGDHAARGGAAGFLGLAAWARGDVTEAIETFGQAVASLRAAGNAVDELSSTVLLADMWRVAGRPGTARRLCATALARAESAGEPVARATAELHVALSELDREAGDLEAAKQHLDAAREFVERGSVTESRYRWFRAMGRVADTEGDLDGAIGFLEQAEQLYRPGFYPDVHPVAATRARVWIRHGNLAKADGWARDRGVSASDDATYLREYDELTLARLVLARHRERPDAAAVRAVVVQLGRLELAAETQGRSGSTLEIRMLLALAHDALGESAGARDTLASALAEAPEPEASVRLLLDKGPTMTRLLHDLREHSVAGAHARFVLSAASATWAGPGGSDKRPTGSMVEPLSERERQVLRLLDSELSAPEIARELFVSHNTVRTHTKHIFTKLGVTNRRAAVARAREHGLL